MATNTMEFDYSPYNQHAYQTGKTSYRLYEDLTIYDPTEPLQDFPDRNLLCHPPPYGDIDSKDKNDPSKEDKNDPLIKFTTQTNNRHKHQLMFRPGKSTVPELKARVTSRPWTVSSICKHCRIHIEVTADSSGPTIRETSPCPSIGTPLHHFRHFPNLSQSVSPKDFGGRWKDMQVFKCTADECPIRLTITTKSPILRREHVTLLTDTVSLRKRTAGIAKFKDGSLSAYNNLKTLKTYLENVLADNQKAIPRENERYVALGCEQGVESLVESPEAREIFARAHFTSSKDEQGKLTWTPPPLSEIRDLESDTRRDIDDMIEEVKILQDRFKGPDDGKVYDGWSDMSKPFSPAYAVLGLFHTVPDQIVIWAYERQLQCNPDAMPVYYQCLRAIAYGRNNEDLIMEATKRESVGAFTVAEVKAARAYLNISPGEKDEDLICGIFKSTLADSTPEVRSLLKSKLKLIGESLKSRKIQDTAGQVFSDVNDAYTYLNVTADTDDNFIYSIYQVHCGDRPNDKQTALEALRMIAESRNSSYLHNVLTTSGDNFDVTKLPITIDSAYQCLGIDVRSVDDELITGAYTVRKMDQPSRAGEFANAMIVIAEHRNSSFIREFIQSEQPSMNVQGPQLLPRTDTPVGLENIGNTCYLNSLLQFYFTIEPLRNMVLNFDQYQEEFVTPEILERKRVGGRRLTEKEIARAKQFVELLRGLFNDLITTNQAYVTPTMDLAYLALVTSKAEEEGQDSHNIEDSIVDVSNNNDNMDVDLPTPEDGYNAASVQDKDCDDVASEITLVGDGQDVEMSDDFQKKPASAESKENVEPEVMQIDNSDSPPHLNVMKLDSDGSTGAEAGSPLKDSGLPTPRNSPPPIPARPAAVKDRKYSIDPSLFGKQQDVSESIGNVLFQLEAAIRPVSIDENGEQQDLIKECFYGQTKQTLAFPDSSEVRTKVESFAHLLVNVDKTEQDIYSALDSSFDSEQVDLEGKHARRYLSITKLPPILSIQVQRVQFNREAGSAYKSHTALNFPETLYMDRYPRLRGRRPELRQLQDLRAKLMESQGRLSPLISLDLTKNYAVTQLGASEVDMENSDGSLGDVGVDPLLPTIVKRGLELINNRITAADNKIKDLQSRINQQFTDLRNFGYRIHAVFIHSGTHNFGHYWIYIHDFEKRVWRKYNDEHVTEVTDENIIFKQAPGDKVPTPYFLVYVRENQTDLTKAVKREIVS
ncbi:hypothetical protein FPQ18DRAFT_337814 [Pyronema domesticum]|nr:hypothetical protein FPQ18DRAFT_337814 [Pyronema domesticum]